uniref:Replication-associated protein n=1 Tax=Zosterops erythropleurus Genomoviridae sp. TaxID=2814957 RepID=A0A8E7G1L8_9VIRU
MPEFTCNARYFLVTYPQCGDLDGFDVVGLFSSLGAECIVGREHHEDGGLHLHCFADFGRKFRSRKTDVFDLQGHHPNIEPSKGTPEKGYDYAIKDGDVVAGGLERPIPTSGTGARTLFDKWTEITSAPDREQFWELCHQLDPKSAACSFGQLAKYADWKYADKPAEYHTPAELEFFGGNIDGRDQWVQQAGIGLGEPRRSA